MKKLRVFFLIFFTAGNQDSFLNSHSEDAEKEKKLLEFLDEARFTSERKENDKFSLSDAIESTYQSNTNEKKERVFICKSYIFNYTLILVW